MNDLSKRVSNILRLFYRTDLAILGKFAPKIDILTARDCCAPSNTSLLLANRRGSLSYAIGYAAQELLAKGCKEQQK